MPELKVRVGIDGTGFQAGMNRLQGVAARGAAQIGGALSTRLGSAFAGGAAVAGISRFIDRVENFTSNLLANSEALGVSTTFLQQWGFAAGQSNVRVRDAEKGLSELTRRLGDGSDAFAKWGIATVTATGETATAEQVLGNIADKMAGTASASQRAAMAHDLFGKSGHRLIPILKGGNAAMREMMGLAPVVSEEQIQAVDKLSDAWSRLKQNVDIEGAKMVGTVARLADELGRALGLTVKLSAVMEQGAISALFNNAFLGIPTILKEIEKLIPAEFDGKALDLPANKVRPADVKDTIDRKEGAHDFSTPREPFSMSADSATKIGGFIGGTTPGMINSLLGSQQLAEVKKTNAILSRVERLIAEGGPVFSNDAPDDGSL